MLFSASVIALTQPLQKTQPNSLTLTKTFVFAAQVKEGHDEFFKKNILIGLLIKNE